jgi:hypothetical protein
LRWRSGVALLPLLAGVLDDTRREQAEQALLRFLFRQRHHLQDLACAGRAVDARQHEAVGGRQRQLLEA